MNYKTRNWLERFGDRICSIGPEGGGDGGGGGATDTGGDPSTGNQGDDGGSPDSGDAEPVDLTSTDAEYIVNKFPKDHRLTEEQLGAVMGWSPKAKAQPKDPTVPQEQQPQQPPVQKKGQKPQQQVAPQSGDLKPGQKKAGDPHYDHKLQRWRDGKTNKIIAAPKGAVVPAAPQGQPPAVQPQPQATPEQIAAAAAAAAAKALQQQGGPGGQQSQGGGDSKQQQIYYGGVAPAIGVPDELAAMIFDEDPAKSKQGVEMLVNGLGNNIMQNVAGMVQYMVKQAMGQVPAMVSAQTSQKASSNAFYDRHPALNKPQLHAAINSYGQQVFKQWQQMGLDWRGPDGLPSEDFMDAVAVGFAEATGISLVAAQSDGQPAPGPANSKKRFHNRTSSARPPAATEAQNKSAEIANVIGIRPH